MKLYFVLCVALLQIYRVKSFFGLRSNDVDDDDAESNAIFDYNLFLKSPNSARVDSKSKVETLGNVLKGHIGELKRSSMHGEIDVIFLVDSSTSVGKTNFVEEIKFVKKLLSDFTVDVNDTRVSVITFSSRDSVIRHVDYFSDEEKFRNKCSLMDDLRKIEYSGGGTYTLGGLLEAKKVLKNARPTASKVIFLLTDGFSNGGDPTVEARILRQAGVKIFTFGIQNGNIVELYDMASAPKNESTYILDSFEEFESLANRALHEDLNVGRYVVEPDRKCNRLCVGRDCCDPLASCKCGTHTGKYECLCPPGYYGNGLRGGCQACPAGTYKLNDRPGDVRTCVKCPDENHVTDPGATSIEHCVCRKGYRTFANNGCAVLTCPLLSVPKNGYFVNDKCKNVFNAACGLRCKPGYELRGSSLRICREDGTWSGVDTQCIMKTCPALMKPKNGNMICTTDDFSFNTVCRFTCDTGYKLVGSRKRTCLAIAFWTGINTRCREITCRPLPVVRDGVTYPASCTAGDVPFGTTCTVTCHTGYSLVGPYNKQCLPEGVWSPASEPSQCIDTAPPFIMCPYNIEADCDLNENTATVSWQVPLAVDNSGYVPILSSHPAVMPPEKFPIGTTKVTYIAEDLNKNKADCQFYIVVKDRQKPSIDRCFPPLPIVSADVYTEVTWEEPLFSDNSGEEVRIRRSHAPGLFPLGITEVLYTAYDASGNSNNCTMKINVIPHACEYPPVPLNGNRTCYEDSQGVVCMFSCKPGYDFAITPARQYTCAFDNVWEPRDRMPVSDCSVLELSNEIIQPASFTFAGLVACQEKIELTQLERDFERKISKRINELCEEGVDCSIRDLETTCRENKIDGVYIVLSRDKRSVSLVPRVKREALEEEHEELSRDKRSVPRVPRAKRDAPEEEYEEYETLNATVTFKYKLAGKVKENTGAGAKEVSDLQEKLLVVFENIKTTMEKDARRGELDLEVAGQPLSLQGFELQVAPVFTCETGSVIKGRSCAKCPVGTFFNIVSRECEGCPRGTFQPLAGQVSCLYCPSNTSTTEPFSVSQQNCTALCLPGTFSNNTVEPCETCRRSYYQDQYGQTDCERCPKRHTTLRRGVMDPNECKEKCSAGYVSKTGVEPCWPCPRGTYQSKPGKSVCIKCPGDADTIGVGSIDVSDCELEQADNPQDAAPPEVVEGQQAELAFDDCFSLPCQNNATCTPGPFGQGFECICTEGFGGVHCDQEVNECDVNPCLHEGTCEDALGDYICHCDLGYTGKKCETDIDDCADIFCLNGGSCIDQLNGFMCSCINGYTGFLCETNIDECVSAPCLNGGSCVDGVGGYRCECPHGLRGEHCEIDDDDCANGPCQHDATCVDNVDGYTCECPPGYEGENCETDTDECASGPCLVPATCEDLLDDYKCICPTAKGGRNCDQDIDPNFQLDFPRTASTTDYAMTSLKQDLTVVTVCFWMKTDDSTNQGTAFSYANEDGDNIFTLTNYDGWVLYVNGDNRTTSAKANTGKWVHVCVLWSSNRGSWKIYVNGIPSDSGRGFASGQKIKGGGVFVIGQEQDSLGGDFNSAETFIGKLTQLNMWGRELGLSDIDKLRLSCDTKLGDVIAWTDISGHVFGTVKESPIDFCKDCPEPPKFDFGDARWTSLRAGSEVQYSCKVGFQIIGRPTALCLVTGEWEGTPPNCARVQCFFPRTPKNGFIIEGTDYTFDHRVRFSCNKGFVLVGSDTLYCGELGIWEGETPTCEAIKCSIPALSENTRVINPSPDNKYSPGTDVFFECSEGNHFYTEHTSVHCNSYGAWDQSIPTCDPHKCGLPPKIENGGAVFSSGLTEFPVGTILEYTCEYANVLAKDGSNKDGRISCLPDGSWSSPLPQCRLITCPKPQAIANGNYTYDTLEFLGQVRYTCYPGYESSHKDVIECFENGAWSQEPPKCEPVRCSRPDLLLHGGVLLPENEILTYGVSVKYECNLGYLIVGNTTRTCTQDATWSGTEPVCKAISCGKPKSVEFGQIVGRDFTLNNVIRYVCNEGYELTGADQSTCRETGKWQNEPPVCSKVSCNTPAAVANGFYTGQSYLYQDSVIFECEKGYQLIGDATLTCQSNRKWSIAPPECEAIKCASPPYISHAKYTNPQNLEQFDIGNKVQYICEHGYEISANSLNPRGEIECIDSGFWEANLPECLIISCPQPSPILNGKTLYEALTFGSSVTFVCDDGYGVEGLDVLTCEASGKWTAPFPLCVAQVCIAPEFVLNGELRFKDLNVGSVIRYVCNEGYQLFGEEVRRCLADLSWSGSEPRCVPVDCGVPQSVQHGNTSFKETFFQSSVSYACDKGYYLVGDSVRVCLRNKTWSGSVPTCEMVQCDRPSKIISNGRLLGDNYTYGSVVTYECDPGYFIDGVTNNRTCLETGEWDRPIVVCTAVECPRLFIRNGQTSGFQTEYGTTLTVSCKRGFRLVGPSTKTCLQGGQWSGNEALCVKYNCPHLEPPVNGEVFVEFHSIASFMCLPGYNMNGEKELRCLDNDTWSADAPTCEAMECPDVTQLGLPDGKLTYESLVYGSTIYFECDAGFFLSGGRSIECQSDGTWSGEFPVCERLKCYPPYVTENSRFIGDDLSYRATIEFVCDKGYKLRGQSTRTCQANGLWSGIAPTCELIFCPRPVAVNVVIIGNDYSFGSVLEYRCNEGYGLVGPSFRNCTESGQWSGTEPTCVRNECPRTKDLTNGRFQSSGNGPGARVTFQCNEGYTLVGLGFKLCLKQTLQWSSADPTCERVSCPDPPSIPNGKFPTKKYFYLDTVEYQCNDGFQKFGLNVPICTSSGTWSRSDIECLKISCGKLVVPENVVASLPGNEAEGRFDETAQLSCVEGYVGRGVNQQKCLANGAWTKSDFRCEVVECPVFGSLKNGRVKSSGNKYGNIVEVQCDEGFYLAGKSSLKCGADGNWDYEYQPVCEENQCEEPKGISNGFAAAPSRAVGAAVTYTCAEGFRLHGSNKRVCDKNGTWSGSDPYCRLVICEVPPHVEHAKPFDTLTQYLYRFEARYICETGYFVSEGDAVLTCSESGQWTGKVPTCSLIKCKEPIAPTKSKVLVASFTYGSEAQYLCFPGYRLKGPTTVRCDETGNWKGVVPECVPIDCGNPPVVANSIVVDSGDHTYNNQIFYNCEVGFQLVGESSHKCLATGVWSGTPPVCEPISCGVPPKIAHAIYQGSSHRYLDKVAYVCLDGYELKGNNVLQCAYDGAWQGKRPECVEITCRPPPVFDHASTSMSVGAAIGSEATFVCNEGYYLVGSARAICMADKTWRYEDDVPTCTPMDCGTPPQVAHARSTFTSTLYEALARYTCDQGYNMVSGGQLRCGSLGAWVGPTTKCEVVTCGSPPNGGHMTVKGNGSTYGSTVSYQCDGGYELMSEKDSVCLETGMWSVPSPECQRVRCKQLHIHENGITVNGNFNSLNRYGDRIVLGCAEGYRMVGEASLECMENGRWSTDLPTCEPIYHSALAACTSEVLLENARPMQGRVTTGSQATVTCAEGYMPTGNMTATCGLNRKWSLPEGRCASAFCGKPRLRDFVNVVSISGTSYFYGDVITYRCRAGVQPARFPPAITCLSDGTWDGEIACGVTCKRPCQHGGICLGLNRCKCTTGYGGPVCEHAICILPCLNGGACAAPYKCSCPDGWEGVRCQKAVCHKPCANGGRCVKPNGCLCNHGYGGAFCEINRRAKGQ